jgi:hypothetical protein
MKEPVETIRQIDLQLQQLLNVRAMFPAISNDMVGQKEFATAPFYQERGFRITFTFTTPLTSYEIEKISEIGRWINHSFLIRLCAMLESRQIIPSDGQGRINQQLDGHEELDILRRLRNVLVHTPGRYDSTNPDERKLYQRIVSKFAIEAESPETARDFPVPIDKLLIPLAEGCKRYILTRQSKER